MQFYTIDGFLFPKKSRGIHKYSMISLFFIFCFCVLTWKNAISADGDAKIPGFVFSTLVSIVTVRLCYSWYLTHCMLKTRYSCREYLVTISGMTGEFALDMRKGYRVSKFQFPFYYGKTKFDVVFLAIAPATVNYSINIQNNRINTISETLKTGILLLPYEEDIVNWLMEGSSNRIIPEYPSSLFVEHSE